MAQRQLGDAQSALLAVEGGQDEYRRRLSIEEQRCGGLDALLCRLCGRLLDHVSLLGSVRDFLRQGIDRDIEDHLQAIFTAARNSTFYFCSGTSNIVERHGATLCKSALSILTHMDGRLAALTSEPSLKTPSDPLGPADYPPPS